MITQSILSKLSILFIDLFCPLTLGYMIHHYKKGWDRQFDSLIHWNLLYNIPCLCCFTFWIVSLHKTMMIIPFIGVVMQIIPGLIGVFYAKLKYRSNPHLRGSYVLTAMFANRSIIGLLSVYILYGEQGYAYARLTMLFGIPVFYLIGFNIARYYFYKGSSQKNTLSIKKMLFSKKQAPVYGLLTGLILNSLKIERPNIIDSIVSLQVHLSAWMFLIPLGYGMRLKQIHKYIKECFEISILRFMIIPFIIYLMLNFINLTSMMKSAILVLSFTPASVGAVIAAKANHLNTEMPMSVYILTTFIYLSIVYPILIMNFN